MSRKNRALALAAATAAIVGLSAPVAGAATLQGPSGFNNDSILNLSGNQLPMEACNLGIPVDVLLAQIPLTGLGLVDAGMLNSTTMSPTTSQTCTQTPSRGEHLDDGNRHQLVATHPRRPGTPPSATSSSAVVTTARSRRAPSAPPPTTAPPASTATAS